MASVLFDIEEFDDLLENGTLVSAGPIGGGHKDERFVDSQRLLLRQQRDPAGRMPQLADEAVGEFRAAGVVDEKHLRPRRKPSARRSEWRSCRGGSPTSDRCRCQRRELAGSPWP